VGFSRVAVPNDERCCSSGDPRLVADKARGGRGGDVERPSNLSIVFLIVLRVISGSESEICIEGRENY
jgi:hypothetical protein